jgi:hypothetical protein
MIVAHLCETATVVSNTVLINKMPLYQPRGPFPLADSVGMSLAVDMLVESLVSRGRIERQIQFSTIRWLRATYTKNWESSPKGAAEGASFAKGLGQIRPTSGHCNPNGSTIFAWYEVPDGMPIAT